MSAVFSKIDEPFVAEALETVREQNLRTWARDTIGLTVAAIRRIVLGGTKITYNDFEQIAICRAPQAEPTRLENDTGPPQKTPY